MSRPTPKDAYGSVGSVIAGNATRAALKKQLQLLPFVSNVCVMLILYTTMAAVGVMLISYSALHSYNTEHTYDPRAGSNPLQGSGSAKLAE